MEENKKLPEFINSLWKLPNGAKEKLVKNLICFFLEEKNFGVIAELLKICDQSYEAEDLFYQIITDTEKIDSRELLAERKKQLMEFLLFLRKESPTLYADLFYTCCLRHFNTDEDEDKSEFFPESTFDIENPRGFFGTWLMILLERIINMHDMTSGDMAEHVFNDIFSRRIVLRVIPETRSMFEGEPRENKILPYLINLVDFILKLRNDKYSIFLTKNSEVYKTMLLHLPQIYEECLPAFQRLRECALYHRIKRPNNFNDYIPERLTEQWCEFKDYYETEDGLSELRKLPWFKEISGIVEIVFP